MADEAKPESKQPTQLEDAYWGELATIANREKSLGIKETMDFLHGDD